MKYIRTEGDNIIAYDENASSLDKPMILSYPNKFTQADTIDELCDELVIIIGKGKNSHKFVADSKRIATWNASLGAKVYGAIWTDKGLKYIAKMNRDGKLELL